MTEVEKITESSFDEAWQSACAWRGRCINVFAGIENRIVEAFAELAPSTKIRRLAGQRSSDLLKQIETVESKEASDCRDALATWREFETHRAWLAHGHFTVPIGRDGAWFAIISHKAVDVIGVPDQFHAYSRERADNFEKSLKKAANRLRNAIKKIHNQQPPAEAT